MAGRLQRLEEWLTRVANSPMEVILIHDRQDEETGPQIQSLLSKISNPKIQLIEDYFGSPGLARNRGIELAKGKWICFWDSDDLPNLGVALSLIDKDSASKADCLITNFNSVNEITKEVIAHQLRASFEDEFSLNPGLWRIYFKYSAIADLRFGSLRMAEDQIFLAEFFSKSRDVEIVWDTTYNYFFGESFHLTKNSKALNDLAPATIESLRILRNLGNQPPNLIAGMFVKQVISGVKYGSLKAKRVVITQYLKSLLTSSNSVRKSVLSSSTKVILAKVK
jgi:glycosyltransferase involved in cell wall biosynthesis